MAKKQIGYMSKWVYDAFLWSFSILVELFFREVHPRGSWKVPKDGPVIFVCAPHANQFVDPLILMRIAKQESARRIHVLIAEKSMKRKFIGFFAGLSGAVPVGRAMDSTVAVPGKIYLPDPVNDPCLVRGTGTKFGEGIIQVGGSLILPKVDEKSATAEIVEIKGPEELRLKRPFKGGIALQQLTGRNDMTEDGVFVEGAADKLGPAPGHEGSSFKFAPKLDQTEVYDAVHAVLHDGGTIGIFPEGGSHDRTDLLPLKAGVAIMALGTVQAKRDCNLKVIPVGMNYFHAHKFRSRAVIEFGNPIDVPAELVDKFAAGQRRDAISELLETIREGLIAVTVTTPDYDTLMLIQAVRRLYNPTGTKLPLPRVVELNRRLVQGYTRYQNDPRIVDLKKEVVHYNQQLLALRIRDHQVQYARVSRINCFFLFWYRLGKLALLSLLVLPGLALFSLVFVFCKVYSIKKAKEALAASTVKVEGKDVLATWKLLVAMAVAPLAYALYIVLVLILYSRNNLFGYLPDGIHKRYLILVQMVLYPTVTYAALRFGEVAMDIAKSLVPLVKMLTPGTGDELVRLKARRERLAGKITDIINTLGPEMFDDFYSKRIIQDPFTLDPELHTPERRKSTSTAAGAQQGGARDGDEDEDASGASTPLSPSYANQIPRNESFADLANQDFFSTRPPTPTSGRKDGHHGNSKDHHRRNTLAGAFTGRRGSNKHHTRTPSGGAASRFELKPFSTIQGSEDLKEVSRRIKSGMGARRRKGSAAAALAAREAAEGDSGGSADEGEDGGVLEMRR